jgi:hypothetical protein
MWSTTMTARRFSALLLASALGLLVFGGQGFAANQALLFGGTGSAEIKLDNPQISGTGPYTVVIRGTLSIDKDTKGFVGTKAKVKVTLITYDASVSLPKGNPEPGKAAVPVVYTWSAMPNKGTYNGDAVLEYQDSNGVTQSHKANVQFKIN